MKSKLHFIFCVEKGVLEHQAKLLVNSIKQFFSNKELEIHAYSPREDSLPSLSTIKFFKENNVDWVCDNLNVEYKQYPIANKVLACNHFEKSHPEIDNILFVDTDTVFLNPVNLTQTEGKILLRPVDNKGPGSEGENDKNDEFWKNVFDLFSLERPKGKIETTVGQSLINSYFNAGFIWAHKLPGFFEQWHEDFKEILLSDLRPLSYQSRENNNFRCLDQVALAVTVARFRSHLEILPLTYNYPVPFRPRMQDRIGHPEFKDLVHVHYHKWFQHPFFLDHVTNEVEKHSQQYKWLKNHLPLSPNIEDVFKC